LEQGSDLVSLFIKLNKLRATLMLTETKAMGLSGPQFFILRELFLQQPKTIGELSKALELSNSTVTGIIDRMERRGLVQRKRDEKDRRVVWVSMTENCMLLKKDRFEKIREEFRKELEQSITPEQFALVRSLLETMISKFEKMLEETT
jgi:DNA-binding MarR family transcriptional regulator